MTSGSGNLYRSPFWVFLDCTKLDRFISYPGYTTSGIWWSLLYAKRVVPFKGSLPPMHSLLVGACFWASKLFGDNNIGIFLGVMSQAILFAVVLAYGFVTMQRLKTPRAVYALTWVLIALCPYYTDYIVTFLRDNPYSYGVLLLQIELIYLFNEKDNAFSSVKHYISYCIGVLLTAFFRNNGLLLVLTTLLVELAVIVNAMRKAGKPARCVLLTLLKASAPVLFAGGGY